MHITSTAFTHGGAIPTRYTCEGDDIAPPLTWHDVPPGTRSFVLIIDDPDAPDPAAPKMTWVHWTLYNVPPTLTSLPEGSTVADLPAGTIEGWNDFKRTNYGGPCPPIGRHRYFHKLYALDRMLEPQGALTKPALLAAMRDAVLASAELMGTYQCADR